MAISGRDVGLPQREFDCLQVIRGLLEQGRVASLSLIAREIGANSVTSSQRLVDRLRYAGCVSRARNGHLLLTWGVNPVVISRAARPA